MRASQKRQTAKEQSQPKPVKALWQSKQYDHVQSKVKQKLEEVSSKIFDLHFMLIVSPSAHL